MAISRSLMNRQLQANGGIMQVAPREKFGLGSSLKKFVRKIIPNEVAEIATKAAPFVAPFNPALAGAMAGIGSFDQTGSIGDSLKRGALTYGGGQAARYIGGAGFQSNPFASGGAFTPSGFTQGFSSPIGTDTGLGKFFSNRGTAPVEGITADAEPVKSSITESFVTADAEPVASKVLETSITSDAVPVASSLTKETIVNNNPGFIKTITEGFKNKDYGSIGNAVLDQSKKFGKAMFTKPDGKGGTTLDKAAVMGALAFSASYMEAKALAAELGVDEDLTEAEYDELTKADKKEEYASYLTNFFAGRKDGGRIGFKEGSDNPFFNLIEKISPLFVDEDGDYRSGFQKAKFALSEFIAGKGTDLRTGAEWYNKLDPETQKEIIMEKIKYRDRGELGGVPLYDEEFAGKYGIGGNYADGGRIGFKFGSEPEEAEIGIMAIDVEAGDDEEEENDLMAGITFNRAERAYLFKKLGSSYTSGKSKSMPNLYYILNNPGAYPADAAVLKQIAIMGMGKKDGGRIGFKSGSGASDRVAQLMLERDFLLSKDEDVSFIDIELERDFGIKMKAEGGIMEAKIPTGQIRKNNAGVVERDYRDEGGFVPVGIKERADDVPAMLSKNEFVMTADAVRGIGNGSVEEGSKKLYNTMKQAEKVGRA